MSKELLGLPIKAEIVAEISSRIEKGQTIHAYVIFNPASFEASAYKDLVSRLLIKLGLLTYVKPINSQKEAEEAIKQGNDDPLGSIFICRPLKIENENKAIELVDPLKDADMLTSLNEGELFKGDLNYLSGTSASVLSLLDYYKIDVQGKRALVIGRSISVGLPICLLLLKKNALLSIAHSKVSLEDIKKQARESHLIVLAAGKRGLVDETCIRPDQIIIDCGYQEDGHGDLGFIPDCLAYTPVPKGVGPITIARLILNAFRLKYPK